MALSKKERAELFMKYEGCCAYCGDPLQDRWHAEHIKAVRRIYKYVRGKGRVATGKMRNPENDVIENMNPTCPPCNLDKKKMSLETWRKRLENTLDVLMRNNNTYKHAKRFGLVVETPKKVIFHFEKVQQQYAKNL